MHERIGRLKERLRHVHWKKVATYTAAGMIGLLIVVQLAYPGDRLLPLTRIDGQQVGWLTKSQAIDRLNASYRDHALAIYLGKNTKPFSAPTLAKADVVVNNTERIQKMNYPWYLRLVPTSLLWAPQHQGDTPAPTFGAKFEQFVDKTIMGECQKAPVNASLKPEGDKLAVVPASPGGECQREDVLATLKKVRPTLTTPTTAKVAQKDIPPTITDATAQDLAKQVNDRVAKGVPLQVGDQTITVSASDALSWLDVSTNDDKLALSVNPDKASKYLGETIAPKVAVKPGISYITTVDFTETSRVNGAAGQTLDLGATAASISAVINGKAEVAQVATKPIAPTEQYTRSYSPTDAGLSALLANYAKDHSGTYGISLIEMDGKKRRANYNGDKQFVTASTYKLLVAYSLLKRIDAGTKDWDSNAACFNKMISLSDNPCSEAFLNDLGLTHVTKDVNAIGLTNSNFTKSGGPFTTANDLALLLGMLQSGQNFSSLNRTRLINAMTANVYRKGIPAGASGTVADKVGFMDDLLHDAAIVYSPSGTYVLVVMTQGSSWSTIADLAKQIDTLRAQ